MNALKQAVKDELSGAKAMEYVSQLTMFHRIQGSTMLNEAAKHIRDQAVKAGLKEVTIHKFPADGKSRYWTYLSPVGWTVESAELRMLEPENELLARFEDIPQSLHTFSKGTPKEGVVGELVDVGAGTSAKDYEGKNVKGRIVLATGRAKAVHHEAVIKRGAAGVVTDKIVPELPGVRESMDIPDAHAYQGIWPSAEDVDKMSFGFSLSRRQGAKLRGLHAAGKKIKLKAIVDASIFKGTEDVVTAVIPGAAKRGGEVFISAHYCHPKPGANDNASGSGLLLEVGRTIVTLIAAGRIPRPTRSIRLIWVPETLGSTAYLAGHPEQWKSLVAGINLDMVGEDQELCGSTLSLDRTPDSNPSYLNDLVESVMHDSPKHFDVETKHGSGSRFRLASNAFGGGSDHAEFNEQTVKVPCVMLGEWPDKFYHTSEDTIDKVSEDSLRRTGWITAVSILTIASADEEVAFSLANLAASKGGERIVACGRAASENILESAGKGPLEVARAHRYGLESLDHVAWRDKEAVRSAERLAPGDFIAGFAEARCMDLDRIYDVEKRRLGEVLGFVVKKHGIEMPIMRESKEEREAGSLVPLRLFKGTLSGDLVRESLTEEQFAWHTQMDEEDPSFYKKCAEALNFADGERNLVQIAKAVSAEYDPTDVAVLVRYFRDLEKAKLVKFVSARRAA